MHSAVAQIADELIRAGVSEAVQRTLLPALVQRVYPGHFTVTADGSHFGSENTWPGLDSWEMAGAYLLLGEQQAVLDYFAFVRASQRHDGNIPFAIFPAEAPPEAIGTYLRGLHYPEDIYSYTPPGRPSRRWIGLFQHWQTQANPLSVLGAICYVLTAADILASKPPRNWAQDNIDSLELAGRYILSRKSPNGLIAGAGFYVECPPRNQWDGVTQCYAVAALRILGRICGELGLIQRRDFWNDQAGQVAQAFDETFWCCDHFAEYVHPEHGLVDLRGLTDVNWAAIGLDVASDEQAQILWPRLMRESSFWAGGMPTQLVSRPGTYEAWELPEPLPFTHAPGPLYDVAAMGRVWFLEALACLRMGERDRLIESVRLVCQMGKRHDWQWHERYQARDDGQVHAAGPPGYCEYAAVLVRVVLGNAELFLK